MGVFDRIFAASSSTHSLTDDFWFTPWGFAGKAKSGVDVSPDSSLGLSTYYACVKVLSEDCGKLPFKVYRTNGRGKEPIPDHPAYRTVHDRFNDDLSAQVGRETLTSWAAGWGGGYAEIVRRPGRVELFPIHPARVNVKRTPDGRKFYEVKNGSQQVDIEASDMFHLRGLGDADSGYSVARLGVESIGRALAVQEFGAKYFANGTTSAGVFKTTERIGIEKKKEIMRMWPKGLPDAHKPMFLDGGLEWQSLAVNPEEAQFLGTMQFTVPDVCRWFRMAPYKVQHLEGAIRANVEQQSVEHVTDTLMPWLVRWEQEVQLKLVMPSERDVFARHVVLGLLRGDSAARASYFRERFNTGSMSPNDIREAEDENPIDDDSGDKYYLQSGMTTIEKINDEPELVGVGQSVEPPPFQDRNGNTAKALLPVVVEAIGRADTKRRKAQARKKGGEMEDWMIEFGPGHRRCMLDNLEPIVRSLTVLQGDESNTVIDRQMERLRSLIGEQPWELDVAAFSTKVVETLNNGVRGHEFGGNT